MVGDHYRWYPGRRDAVDVGQGESGVSQRGTGGLGMHLQCGHVTDDADALGLGGSDDGYLTAQAHRCPRGRNTGIVMSPRWRNVTSSGMSRTSESGDWAMSTMLVIMRGPSSSVT